MMFCKIKINVWVYDGCIVYELNDRQLKKYAIIITVYISIINIIDCCY